MKTLITILLLVSMHAATAVTISNFSQPTNDRFTGDASFIGAGLDFSGVGRDNTGKWATMIGDNYFISANHFHSATDGSASVTFASGGSTYQYTVAGGSRVGSTDLWIGYFNDTVDSSIARYAISNTSADTLAETGIGGTALLFSGNGSSVGPFNHVVGHNTAEIFSNNNSSAEGTFDALGFVQNLAVDDISVAGMNDAALTHEAHLQNGDSGSPLFSVSGSTLTIEGIAWAVTSSPINSDFDLDVAGNEDRNGSFYNYAGSYESEIASVVASIPAPVPEPSSLLYGLLAAPMMLLRRRQP